MLEAAARHPRFEVRAVSDIRIRELPVSRLPTGVRIYHSLEEMLQDETVEVVHVATPTPLHFEDARSSLSSGRHVIVEKPMTSDEQTASLLVSEVTASGCALIVGHSRGFDPIARAMAELVAAGSVGHVGCFVSTQFTEWLRRPRRPDELDPEEGGGLLYRQVVHQLDVIRTVLGGDHLKVCCVRTRQDVVHATPGSYLAWLDSDSGVAVSLLVDGTGALLDKEARREPGAQESASAQKRRQNHDLVASILAGGTPTLGQEERDSAIVLGEKGSLVAKNNRLQFNGAAGTQTIDLSGYPDGRSSVLDEMYAAIVGTRPVQLHDAAWGLENIRTCGSIARAAMTQGRQM